MHFPLFRQIGDALGPFDLATLPIGAYEPQEMNKEAHVNPKESVQMHHDLQSQHSIAMHWGSFPLGEEELDDPPKQLELALAEAAKERIGQAPLKPFTLIEHGSTIEITKFQGDRAT